MEIFFDDAIIINTDKIKLVVDPDKKATAHRADYAFVTHPHSDHYSGLWNFPAIPKIMNTITYEIITFRNSRKTIENPRFISDTLSLDGVTVRSYPSGHTVGSSQFEFTFSDGIRVAYTGDFCLQSRLGIEKCEIIPNPDILIIDTTYGSKEYTFPNRTDVYKQMISWISTMCSNGVCPVIAVRPVGTAQEVTALLSVTGEGFDVYVNPMIFLINGIFKKYADIGIGKKRIFEEIAGLPNAVFLTPFWGNINDVGENRGICSGWLLHDERQRTFPLSNHGGFDQILSYIKKARPKKILTVYGNCELMAQELVRLGYNAAAI